MVIYNNKLILKLGHRVQRENFLHQNAFNDPFCRGDGDVSLFRSVLNFWFRQFVGHDIIQPVRLSTEQTTNNLGTTFLKNAAPFFLK